MIDEKFARKVLLTGIQAADALSDCLDRLEQFGEHEEREAADLGLDECLERHEPLGKRAVIEATHMGLDMIRALLLSHAAELVEVTPPSAAEVARTTRDQAGDPLPWSQDNPGSQQDDIELRRAADADELHRIAALLKNAPPAGTGDAPR